MEAPWVPPAVTIAARFMGLLQPPPPNNRQYEDQSERDLLITLSVQVAEMRRSISLLTWIVGAMLVGAFPVGVIMTVELVAIVLLWGRP